MGRMMSLSKDRNDQNELRWGRFRNMGASVASEFYQHCPYFYTREGAQVEMIGMFRGSSAFLVASGPSLKTIDLNLLNKPGIWSMTLNNAVRSHRGQASCIVDDPARFVKSLWLDPCIMKFVPFACMEKPLWDNEKWEPMKIKVGDCPSVIAFRRNEKFMSHRFLYEDTINWGCHKQWGGGRSVMLAAIRILFLLGFRNIYLVGVDFEMTDDKRYHFDEGRTQSAVKNNMSTYKKMKKWWSELQPYFLAENFIVKNCNSESKLTTFPFISFEEAIKEASQPLGDVVNERTEGMYSTYQEKMTAVQKEKESQKAEIVHKSPSQVAAQSQGRLPTGPTVPVVIKRKPNKPVEDKPAKEDKTN